MKTITISGAHSNIGKTSLAEEILSSQGGWSALKVTVKTGSGCPRNKICGVCEEIKGKFVIVTDEKIIDQDGTDTARLKKAGAEKVIWLKADRKGLKEGLKRSLGMLKGSKGVVIEGTSVLKYIRPDLSIYLKDGATTQRPQAKAARRKADIIIDASRMY